MLRLLKSTVCVGLLAASLDNSFAFSPIGPLGADTYQVPTIGYFLPGDLGAPKNLGEEYRRNTPIIYYSFDQNFLDYFGSNGVAAVDQAMAIMNGLTNVSLYSSELSEFPFATRRENYTAEALFLSDLKSYTLQALMEQMGLAEPERYVWCLHDRFKVPNTPPCPAGMDYLVIKRNFDPQNSPLNQLQPTSYVNGTLYSYELVEICTGPNPLADAVEFAVDPLADAFTSVAGLNLIEGWFFTGLSHDDVGGLRYLLSTNNVNVESLGPGTTEFITNHTAQLLSTSNLTDLANAAATNDAATLAALFPGLVVSATSNYFANVVVTNQIGYFTNYPTDPVGTAPHLVVANVVTTNIVQFFRHTLGNVVTKQRFVTNVVFGVTNVFESLLINPALDYFTRGQVTVVTTNITGCPLAPPGVLCTNISQDTFLTNILMGEYYIIPPGLCDVSIVVTQLTTVIQEFNTFLFAANTNAAGTNAQQFSQTLVTYFTNHIFVINPVVCFNDTVALRQGVERVRFVRRDFDSLLGQFFQPTNQPYTIYSITNNAVVPERIERLVSTPDILFSARDLASGPDAIPAVPFYARNVNFNAANAYPGLSGPGTIQTPTTISFDKVGPIFLNSSVLTSTNNFLQEANQALLLLWGSFDGTTNAPIVYPNGTSIANLVNQVLIQVTNPILPNGSVGTPYSAQFSVKGGSPPFTWALAVGSAGLPPGLDLGPNNGIVSGTPTQAGTFDFVVTLTDAGGRSVDWTISITIN